MILICHKRQQSFHGYFTSYQQGRKEALNKLKDPTQ